jgi:hypothetical protein
VSVPGTQPWTDTGIQVAQGQAVSTTASGLIRIAGSDPGKDPGGDPRCVADATFLLPGAACWSLIGRIGSGQPFALGVNGTHAAAGSGVLSLGVNDQVNEFGDNSGTWTVRVTVSDPDDFGYPIAREPRQTDIGYGIKNGSLHQHSKCFGVPFHYLYHAGEDWFGGTDTPVLAVADGIVTSVTDARYPGSVVVISHPLRDGGRIWSMYGHLDPDKVNVSAEQPVKKGDVVADGLIKQRFGGQDNTHLHWEMRYFADGTDIRSVPKYRHSCSGAAGPGYSYPSHPDHFVANGGSGPTFAWTKPSAFVEAN